MNFYSFWICRNVYLVLERPSYSLKFGFSAKKLFDGTFLCSPTSFHQKYNTHKNWKPALFLTLPLCLPFSSYLWRVESKGIYIIITLWCFKIQFKFLTMYLYPIIIFGKILPLFPMAAIVKNYLSKYCQMLIRRGQRLNCIFCHGRELIE